MSERPLVSIVTPTWMRSGTLRQRLIPSIAAQTYNNLEHVIVSDGLDPELMMKFDDGGSYAMTHAYEGDIIPYRVYHLGRNSSSLALNSFGIAPNLVGTWLARGKYIVCVADDDVLFPAFIQECVDYLEDEPEIGFVYTGFRHRSATRVYDVDGMPPRPGCVCSPVFRADLLRIGGWQMHDGMTADWRMVDRWIDADIRWGHLDDILMEHFADHE